MTGRQRAPVAGEVPSPINPPSGCTFHPRCPFANERCKVERPLALPIEGGTVACHAIEEGRLAVEERTYAAAADRPERPGTTCTMPDVHERTLGALDPSPRSLTIRCAIFGRFSAHAGHQSHRLVSQGHDGLAARHPRPSRDSASRKYRTADIVADKLKAFGLEVHRGPRPGPAWSACCAPATAAASIGLRADMDALPIARDERASTTSDHPGKMHACGHDGHTAMLLGAAKYLAETRNFDGTVTSSSSRPRRRRRRRAAMVEDGLFEKFPVRGSLRHAQQPGHAGRQVRHPPRPDDGGRRPLRHRDRRARRARRDARTRHRPGAGRRARSSRRCRPSWRATSTRSTPRWSRSPRSMPATPDNVIPQECALRGTVRTFATKRCSD